MQKKEDALKGVKLFVLDMDGTVYLGNHMIDGALDFIHEVDASEDRDYIFFTNNASRVPSVYVEKLHKLGLDVDESKVVTAGDVCAEFLKVNYPGAKVYLNGTPVLEENWKEKGIHLVEEDPDVAVQSFDTTLTYHKLDQNLSLCKEWCSFYRNAYGYQLPNGIRIYARLWSNVQPDHRFNRSEASFPWKAMERDCGYGCRNHWI